MANGIGNNLWVRGPKKELQRFLETIRGDPPPDHPDALFDADLELSWLSLEKVVPRPEDVPEFFDMGTMKGVEDFMTWRGWIAENWGTKWIIGVDVRWLSANELHCYFVSAWSPPDTLLDCLAGRFPSLSFTLDATDPGMDTHWRGGWREGKRLHFRRRLSRYRAGKYHRLEPTRRESASANR